jgi:hypothetical protein
MNNKLLLITLLIFISSCKTEVNKQATVYSNDFENNNLTGIAGGIISQYNSTSVLGRYNGGYFMLTLNNLPKHDLITIAFDLYIHDSWDGNKVTPDGPDIWQMLVDGNSYVYTTFSNTPCGPKEYCSPQSYPFTYPNNYSNPKTGAYRTNLRGVCHFQTDPNGTTLYRIEKTFRHSSGNLLLECSDKLVQPNSPDPKCDESWSVDNIVVKAVTL